MWGPKPLLKLEVVLSAIKDEELRLPGTWMRGEEEERFPLVAPLAPPGGEEEDRELSRSDELGLLAATAAPAVVEEEEEEAAAAAAAAAMTEEETCVVDAAMAAAAAAWCWPMKAASWRCCCLRYSSNSLARRL